MEMKSVNVNQLVEGEKALSIYRTTAVYSRDDQPKPSTHIHRFMVRPGEEDTLANAEDRAHGVWENYLDQKIRHGEFAGRTNIEANLQYLQMDTVFERSDTWLLTWFSHYTLNAHLSDSLLQQSFHNYVERVGRFNVSNGHRAFDSVLENKAPFMCLMGAEDRWRWRGPCRCDECVKLKLTRIDH